MRTQVVIRTNAYGRSIEELDHHLGLGWKVIMCNKIGDTLEYILELECSDNVQEKIEENKNFKEEFDSVECSKCKKNINTKINEIFVMDYNRCKGYEAYKILLCNDCYQNKYEAIIELGDNSKDNKYLKIELIIISNNIYCAAYIFESDCDKFENIEDSTGLENKIYYKYNERYQIIKMLSKLSFAIKTPSLIEEFLKTSVIDDITDLYDALNKNSKEQKINIEKRAGSF